MGLYDESERYLAEAVRLSPDRALYQFNVGLLNIRNDKLTEAGEHLLRAKELEPNDATTRMYLGFVYAKKKKYPQAIAEMTKGVELQPLNQEFRYLLGNLFLLAMKRTRLSPSMLSSSKITRNLLTVFIRIFTGTSCLYSHLTASRQIDRAAKTFCNHRPDRLELKHC